MTFLYTNDDGSLITHESGKLMSGPTADDCCCNGEGCTGYYSPTEEGAIMTIGGYVSLPYNSASSFNAAHSMNPFLEPPWSLSDPDGRVIFECFQGPAFPEPSSYDSMNNFYSPKRSSDINGTYFGDEYGRAPGLIQSYSHRADLVRRIVTIYSLDTGHFNNHYCVDCSIARGPFYCEIEHEVSIGGSLNYQACGNYLWYEQLWNKTVTVPAGKDIYDMGEIELDIGLTATSSLLRDMTPGTITPPTCVPNVIDQLPYLDNPTFSVTFQRPDP